MLEKNTTKGKIKSKADKLTYILGYVYEFQQQQKETTPELLCLHHFETLSVVPCLRHLLSGHSTLGQQCFGSHNKPADMP